MAMNYRLLPCLILILFFSIATSFLYAGKIEEIKVYNIPGKATGDEKESISKIREKAISDAKLNALRKAGIEEHIQAYQNLFRSESSDGLNDFYSSEIFSSLRGGLKDFELIDEKKSINAFGFVEIHVLINATIVKYHIEPDPSFVAQIKGLKQFYENGEIIQFKVNASDKAFFYVFTISENDAIQVYPNTFENQFRLRKNTEYFFPRSGFQNTYTQNIPPGQENRRLFFIITKKDIPFPYQVNDQNIIKWIFSISPDMRFVHTHSYVVFNNEETESVSLKSKLDNFKIAEHLKEEQNKRHIGDPSLVPEASKLICITDSVNPFGIAIVIGNEHYKNTDMHNSDFAINDAASMKDYLIKAAGFQPEHVLYYPNIDQDQLRELFGTPASSPGKIASYLLQDQSELVIFYSGHILISNKQETALCPVDYNPASPDQSSYSLKLLFSQLSNLKITRLTLILDAADHTQNVHRFNANLSSPVLYNTLKFPATFIYADENASVACNFKEKNNGLLSYYLISGLSGMADQDHNQIISLNELDFYLQKMIPLSSERLSNIRQKPLIINH
jgi:hypothetical protein